jgi:hypothetical protein
MTKDTRPTMSVYNTGQHPPKRHWILEHRVLCLQKLLTDTLDEDYHVNFFYYTLDQNTSYSSRPDVTTKSPIINSTTGDMK